MFQIRAFRPVVAAALVVAAASSHAEGIDLSSLTGAVDFSTVATAVLAIAALMVVPLVAKKAARMVLSMIGRG